MLIAKGKANIKYILIVLIVAVVAGLGVFTYQYKFPFEKFVVVNLTRVKSETDSWPTYRNEYWGFEFKYPPSYAEENRTIDQYGNSEFVLGECINLHIFSYNLSAEQYVAKFPKSDEPILQETILIDGIKAIKLSYSTKFGENFTSIYLSKDGNIYYFSFRPIANDPDAQKINSSQLATLNNIVSTFKFVSLGSPENLGFTPFVLPPSPSFISSLGNANDMKINFHYEGDYYSFDLQFSEFYTPEGSNEKFLSLSKLKERKDKYAYGPEYYSVFTSEETHSYQGTPIYLSDPKSNYTVSYVGFKINDRDLISELKIEFGIDYMNGGTDPNIGKTNSSILAKIFGIEPVYACGPGIYVGAVGSSSLTFVEESNGVAWYRLEKPVKLYNLSFSYCEDPPVPMPGYCKNMADDPEECWNYCYYNASITSLSDGNLKMHILYRPNDKEGLLKFQMVNLIVSDSEGNYLQPVMGENFGHFYRAYLH